MFDRGAHEACQPVALFRTHQGRTAPAVGIGIRRGQLVTSTRPVDNSRRQLKDPVNEGLCYGPVDEGLLDGAAALARGDGLSIDEVSRSTLDVGVLVDVEEVDSGNLFHHPLAKPRCGCIDLVTNLMYIFFSFSHFSQLHGVLTSHRIGNDCMKVIDLEIKRYMLRQRELQTMARIAALQARERPVPNKLWEELGSGIKRLKRRSNSAAGGVDEGSKEADQPLVNIERERERMKRFISACAWALTASAHFQPSAAGRDQSSTPLSRAYASAAVNSSTVANCS